MNKKYSADYVGRFTVRSSAAEVNEAEAVPGEANGLNRTISAVNAESLQTTLNEPKTRKKSLCDRICSLWLIRKIIGFFKRLFRSKEVINSADARITDPVDKKTVTSVGESTIIPVDKEASNFDGKNNKTTDPIVTHERTGDGNAHVSGNISEAEQVADKKCSDSKSDVSAATEKHQVDMDAPAISLESATEISSSDARRDQENRESEVVHSAIQNEIIQSDRVMELRLPGDSDSSHNDAESNNQKEASVQLPSSEAAFNDNAENVHTELQKENLTAESARPSASMSLSITNELSASNPHATSLEAENTDTNQTMSEKLVECSMSRESNPDKAEAGMESGVKAEVKAEVDARIKMAAESEAEIRERIALELFERHEQECAEEENKASRKHSAVWLGRGASKSPPTGSRRSFSMLNLSAVSRPRKWESTCDIVSECPSGFGGRVSGTPARLANFREMIRQRKLHLQEHNEHRARMQRLGFGMAKASRF